MKSAILPIPVEADIDDLVRQGAQTTGLKLADVMRQGLRHGVPMLMERLRTANSQRPAKCLDYLDSYPRSTVQAKDYKTALKVKLAKKYDRSNR